MDELAGLINAMAEARRAEEVWQLAMGHFAGLGFGRGNYGFTRFRSAASAGDMSDAIYLTTFGPDYSAFYFRDGFFARTPLYRWALEHDGCCSWRWVEEALRAGRLCPDEAEAVRHNLTLGLRAGLTFSFPEVAPRQKGALGLAADPGLGHDAVDAILARHGAAMQAVVHVMHLRICHLPFPTRRRPLSKRQREALEWVAEGKTTQDIALLMGISPAMVEKHLRLARLALDVETTAQAVAKGMLLNQIFHPEQAA